MDCNWHYLLVGVGHWCTRMMSLASKRAQSIYGVVERIRNLVMDIQSITQALSIEILMGFKEVVVCIRLEYGCTDIIRTVRIRSLSLF